MFESEHSPAAAPVVQQEAKLFPKTRARRIIEWVSKRTRVKPEFIVGASLKHKHIQARWIAIVLVWRHPETQHFSLTMLGKLFGDRDHTSIRHALISAMGEARYDAHIAARLAAAAEKRALVEQRLAEEDALVRQRRQDADRAARLRRERGWFDSRHVKGMLLRDAAKFHGDTERSISHACCRIVKRALILRDADCVSLIEEVCKRPINEITGDLIGRYPSVGRALQSAQIAVSAHD
jgi:Bacterial dnaA protein helix-turn-helix